MADTYLAGNKTISARRKTTKSAKNSPELAIIALSMFAINNDDEGTLAAILRQMPIQMVSVKTSDSLLTMLLTQTWKSSHPRMVHVILDAWRRIYPDEEVIPFYVQLAYINIIEVPVLRFAYINALGSEGVSYFEIMNDIIMDHNEKAILACKRVTEAFGENNIDYDVMNVLRIAALEKQNPFVLNFINSQIRDIAPFQSIPFWVLDFRDNASGNVVPDALLPSAEDMNYIPTDIEIKIPSNKKLLEYYEKGLINVDFTPNEFRKFLASYSKKGKKEIFGRVLKGMVYASRERDPILARLYGPAIMSTDPSDEELLYGGQRMFLSISHPDLDMEDLAISKDWFTGSCDQCLLRIRRRWHAVRIPIPTGGWLGCFCSWGCVKANLRTPSSFDGVPDGNIIVLKLITKVQKIIETVGVQDRKDNGEIGEFMDYNDSYMEDLTL